MSVWFWLLGVKFGKLSKSSIKSPYSPQPVVGIEEAALAGMPVKELVLDGMYV